MNWSFKNTRLPMEKHRLQCEKLRGVFSDKYGKIQDNKNVLDLSQISISL